MTYRDTRNDPRPLICQTATCRAAFIGTERARYCGECRRILTRKGGPKRKYQWTQERDELIRARYAERGPLAPLAALWGYPEHAIRWRAAELGVGPMTPASRKWTPAELDYLEERAGQDTARMIARHLKRSLRSVIIQAHRQQIATRVREGYTAGDLGECFGVSDKTVARWIRLGYFGDVKRRNGGDSDADAYRIKERQVRRFLEAHRTVYSLQTTDQTWFLDLVFESRAVLGSGKDA